MPIPITPGTEPEVLGGGRFEIIRKLGAGGMGAVYEAHDRELGEHVALKRVRAELVFDPQIRERFKYEILNGRRVTHPNVCRVRDLVREDSSEGGPLAFTMDLLAGETLADLLKREGRLPTERALPLVRQIAAGLTALHQCNIVHRDFKPSNVMFVDNGDEANCIKITDFGLAWRDVGSADDLQSLNSAQDIIGTPIYMAPEQLTGERDKIGPATDVYALGLVLCEMVTGSRPFSTETLAGNVVPKVQQSASTIALDLDEKWRRAILACLAVEPGARPESPTEVHEMLEGRARPSATRPWPVLRAPWIGEIVSHYKIQEKLGSGGMGEVWKAEDTHLHRTVALKFLPSEAVGDKEMNARLVREAEAAASLDHPNICAVHDIHEASGRIFIVMAYIDGVSLADRIKQDLLPVDEALEIAIQVAEGLEEAHSHQIVHRDIKPANIMVRKRSHSKLQATVMDFGLARLSQATKLTREGSRLGTAAYMSPEQVEGGAIDQRTDIWALGIVIYEMVVGQHPFPADYEQALFYGILNQQPKPITSFQLGAPLELERIVGKCLAKSSEERYQSTTDLIVDLRELQLAVTPQRHAKDSGSRGPIDVGRQWPYAAAALVVAVLVAVAWDFDVFSLLRSPTPFRSRPLTSYEGAERSPTLSPDGSQVAFAWNGGSGQNYDVYVQVIGSAFPMALTTDPADDIAPAWSPDGRHIAFLRSVGGSVDDLGVIHLTSPLGRTERRLEDNGTPIVADRTGLGWTPDSESLLFSNSSRLDEPNSIYEFTVDDGEIRRLTTPPSISIGDVRPRVSPDGRTLAFVRVTTAGVSNIYTTPMGGKAVHPVTSGVGEIYGLTWTPDSKDIVYSRGVLGQSRRLWRVSAEGASPRRLTGAGDDSVFPVIPQQGGSLVYVSSKATNSIWRYDLSQPAQDSTLPRTLIASTRNERSVQISPDGDGIAFVSNRSGNYEVWVARSDGSNLRQLTSFSTTTSGSPRWSPDGRSIAFDSLREGSWDVYTINLQGGLPRAIVVRDGNDSRPSWSADGRWIYFNSNASGRFEVWKVAADGGEPVKVTSQGGFNPFESSDGKFVYYAKRGMPGIWRMPVAGGDETLVLDNLDSASQGFWDVAEDGVYFVVRSESPSGGTAWLLKFLRFDTRVMTVVADLDLGQSPGGAATPFDVSPDGQWFVLARTDQSDSDLMIVEDFH